MLRCLVVPKIIARPLTTGRVVKAAAVTSASIAHSLFSSPLSQRSFHSSHLTLAKGKPAAAPPSMPKSKQQAAFPPTSSVVRPEQGKASAFPSGAAGLLPPPQPHSVPTRPLATAPAAAPAALPAGLNTAAAELQAAKPAFAVFLSDFVAKQFKAAKEYGPAGVAVWTALYIAPGLGCYQVLLANDNFGLSLTQLLESLPLALQEWLVPTLQTLLRMVGVETGSSAPATTVAALNLQLQPWQTSAALGWVFTELIEPLRFLLTIWIVKRWKGGKKVEAAAAAATAAATAGAAQLRK